MALTDWIRKRHGAAASAIAAIDASDSAAHAPKIAKIASIALANPMGTAAASDPDERRQRTVDALRQFRFDLVEANIAAGHPASDIHRVNNMAWAFMQEDGMTFSDAVHAAAQIVATCEAAACEAAYEDVQALWQRIKERA